MTKEEHAKVLEQTQILRDIAYHLTENGYSMTGRDIKLAALEIEAAIMRKEPEPKETYGFEEWQVLALRAGWICPTPKTEPISDAEIFDIAGNYDCGTNGENMEWAFQSPKELLDFARALLEKAR